MFGADGGGQGVEFGFQIEVEVGEGIEDIEAGDPGSGGEE